MNQGKIVNGINTRKEGLGALMASRAEGVGEGDVIRNESMVVLLVHEGGGGRKECI